MMSQQYVRLVKAFNDFGELVPREKLDKNFVSDKPHYTSVYYYNDKHFQHFQETGSVKGIQDVTTDKIIWDFDNEEQPDKAKADTLELVQRLKEQYNINEMDLEIYYSGNKGFHVVLNITKDITPAQHQRIAFSIAKDLPTFDPSLYDSNQILRTPNTKHNETGLYKTKISAKQLQSYPLDRIKQLALTTTALKKYSKVEFPVEKFEAPVVLKKETVKVDKEYKANGELPKVKDDFKDKPRYWTDYKWSLLQGNFNPGERNNALMVVAATCRGLGYDSELTRAMLESANDKHCKLTGNAPETENIDLSIQSVFSQGWNGGQYSYKNNIWLQQYCARLGLQVSKESDDLTIEIADAFNMFKDYAINIDKLTVKTGIPELDKKLRMTIGMTVGIVAAPGVGKTSLALQILNSMSSSDEQCVFFSYDMYHALVFQKLIQKHLKVSDKAIFEKFKNSDKEFEKKVIDVLSKEYKNVEFCFKTGQTPRDIEETIAYTENKTNKKTRLIVIDYNELVLTDLSDPTAGSAQVAQRLREIATKHNVCVIVLIQPNKMAGSPSDELSSYRNIKGSSALEQSLSSILGMSRPGYDPRHPEDDKFLTIKCLKNRMGELFTLDLGWTGAAGEVYELTVEQQAHLNEVRKRIENEKNKGKSKADEDWT